MKKKFDSKAFALSAVMAALMVILVYLSSLFPVMSLSIVAITGVLSAILVSECGVLYACLAYVTASILMLLIVPDKANAVLFSILFGIYPIISSFLERVKHKWFTWLLKFFAANALFFITYLIFKMFMLVEAGERIGVLGFIWIVYNVIFVMYDICLKKLIVFYKIRIGKHIR